MNNFMKWMTENFAPKVNKIAKNPWISSIQDAILTAIPMIFIGSFATILSIIKSFWKSFPDFSPINTFSFGLFSLFLSYLIPEALMIKKGHKGVSKQAGIAGIAFFLLMIYPTFDKNDNMLLNSNLLGTGGMITALLSGIFVGFVMNLASKYQIFDEDTTMPDFVITWFNTLIPIIFLLLIGWLFTFQLKFNVTTAIQSIFKPLINLGGSFYGFMIIMFLGYSFLYSFGISSWIIYPVEMAIALPGIAENAKMASQGLKATNIFLEEVVEMFCVGGGGSTLALCIMMAFMAKSSRLKMIGRAAIVPSFFNINEPVVFGAPIVFNPILMVPMWIMGLVGPLLTWIVFKVGLIPIPTHVFELWYLPTPIFAYLSTRSFNAVVFVIVLFIISWIVYLPFFKIADKQDLEKEKNDQEAVNTVEA